MASLDSRIEVTKKVPPIVLMADGFPAKGVQSYVAVRVPEAFLVFNHLNSRPLTPHLKCILLMGQGRNLEFLIWQKSYEGAAFGPIR